MAILRTMAERLRETNAMLSERAAKNAVEEIEKHLSWRDKLADRVAEFNGSWGFILGLGALSLLWVFINTLGLLAALDPYPYQFFNLVLAILVGLQGPLIVMSQNRQTIKDRATAETDFKVNLKNEVNIETILREMGEFRAESNQRLEALERRAGVSLPPPAPSGPPSTSRALLTSLTEGAMHRGPPAAEPRGGAAERTGGGEGGGESAGGEVVGQGGGGAAEGGGGAAEGGGGAAGRSLKRGAEESSEGGARGGRPGLHFAGWIESRTCIICALYSGVTLAA